MKRKLLAIFLLICLLLSLALPSYAYDIRQEAADWLYTLGLFNGVGSNPDGTPHYENTIQYAILKKEWDK